MFKKICIFFSCLILLLQGPFIIDNNQAQAADYDREFIEVFGQTSIANARSPLRLSSGSDSWARVNSKNNQPRSSGTNPHRGTDLQATANTLVYPILRGKVVDVNHNTTTQLGSVTLNHDINNDGVYDNYYIKYLHIVPKSGLAIGDTFLVGNSIGSVDMQKTTSTSTGYPPHLHFQRVDNNSNYSYKLYNFYRSVTEWDYGSHLDFISDDVFSSNIFFVKAYAATDNSTNIYPVTGIDLYYKINSSGTWIKSSTGFSQLSSPVNRWMINLKSATGGVTGDKISFYIVAHRQTDPTFSGTYKTAFYPQYYAKPTAPLSSTNANAISHTRVLQ